MKKIIAYSFNLLFLVTFLASCLGDLDTMPLDNNQLVSDQVYKTKDGYTGVLAFPHPGGWHILLMLGVLAVLAAQGFSFLSSADEVCSLPPSRR